MKQYGKIAILLIMVMLSGCAFKRGEQPVPPATSLATTESSLFVLQDSNLIKINADSGATLYSVVIPADVEPISFSLGKTFKTNQASTYVVWFVPGKGLVRFYEGDKSIKSFYQPSEWFYENPYFQFAGNSNTVILIDKKGSEVVRYDLDAGTISQQAVPYPFGTLFVISPDLQRIAYVEGYQQTSVKPSYLITTGNGEPVTQIDTDAEIAHRGFIAWMPDSQALVTIDEGTKIVRYPIEQAARPNVLFELPSGETVIDFQMTQTLLVIKTSSYIYLYDMTGPKLLRKLPLDSMSQLNNPVAYVVDADHFFIEEDVRSFEQTYKRLWKSDWMGNRQILLPAYGKRVSNVSM